MHGHRDGRRISFTARLDMGIPSLADALEPIAARTLVENTVAILGGLLGQTQLVDTVIAAVEPHTAGYSRMSLLRAERDVLEAYLPGLDKYLSGVPLADLEKPGSGGAGDLP